MNKPGESILTRREALRATALAGLGIPLLGTISTCLAAGNETSTSAGLKLGFASVSFKDLSAEKVIAALKHVQLQNVSLYKSHCPWNGTTEQCRAAAQKFKDAGFTITGCGVMDLPNNEAAVRKAFDNARAAGLPTMICSPALDALPLIEKFAKEYDIKIAIHNHGPEDKTYPSPNEAWKAVQSCGEHIGLCIDVGHSWRAGVDPVEAIRKYHSRLYDLHLKDSLAEQGARDDIPADVGKGRLDIKGILKALIEVKYQHIVAFEARKKRRRHDGWF